MLSKDVIGSSSETLEYEVEKGAIRAFAAAIGDDNPLFHDEEFARRQGYRSLIAPPTFAQTLKVPFPGLNVDKGRTLHGAQEFIYTRPIVAGDVLRCNSTVVDVYERPGGNGPMTFFVAEIKGVDPEGDLVFRALTTIIYR